MSSEADMKTSCESNCHAFIQDLQLTDAEHYGVEFNTFGRLALQHQVHCLPEIGYADCRDDTLCDRLKFQDLSTTTTISSVKGGHYSELNFN